MGEFTVTTDRRGSRTFGEHDDRDRWTRGRGSGRYNSGARGGGRGGGGGYSRPYYRGRSKYNSGARGGGRGGGGGYSRPYYRGRRKYNSGARGGGRGGGGGYSRPFYRGRKNFRSYGNRGQSRGRGRGGSRGSSPGPMSRLDDDGDLVMGDDDPQPKPRSRFTPYGRPARNNYRDRDNANYASSNAYGDSNQSGADGMSSDKLQRLGLPVGSRDLEQWHRVTIPFGRKCEKSYILQTITNHVDIPFVPTYFHYVDNKAEFFVSDKQAAMAIQRVNKRVTMPNGYKMIIIVKPSGPPVIPMGSEEIEKLKVCMSNRYDVATKALNLSSLYQDQELQQQDLYMALARDQVMSNVVKIISENIPELVCLDLSSNKLMKLDVLKQLVAKTPDLTMLNFSNNKFVHVEEFRKISGWKINVLNLDGNPLCDRFSDQASFISAVRKVFPKVIKLDGHDLPPPITFDIEARTDLPKSKDSSFPDPQTQAHVVKFLKDYFQVYDSANRNVLGGAYHPSAVFSLSTCYNGAVKFKQPSLSAYIEESRNLLRTNNMATGRKQKLLKYGSLIVPQICLLPKTQHDPNSFIVDVTYTSPSLLNFTVQGVFREVLDNKQEKAPIRSFSRSFITVPGGSGMLIVNDMLTVTNASPDQVQSAFKTPAPTPSSSPVPETSPRNPFEGAGLTPIQEQMITSLMSDSGMNAEFSRKCLADNNWEYQKAGQVFLDLNNKKRIPDEAFMK